MKKAENQSKSIVWQSIGQSGAKHLLGNFLVPEATLPHAFLFFGPAGIGKFDLAKEFAGKIAEKFQATPEQYEFDFEEQNGIDELRELIRLSSLTAAGLGKKVFLLRNFQTASLSSLNSLLKTLEEPSATSVFILISDGNNTLPTIMSRVVPVRCFPQAQSAVISNVNRLEASAAGFPRLMKELQAEPDVAQQYTDLLLELETSAKSSGALGSVNKLSELETKQLQTLLLLWSNWLKQQLSIATQPAKILQSLRAAQTASEELAKNFNTKLVLQELLLQTKI